MRFLNLSPLTVLAGMATLAGILFLLQRLRVRYRERPIVTTLFWREATQKEQARVLVRRFRHPWAYLLVLSICTLLWVALAGPQLADNGTRDHVVLLDGSAGMSANDRFPAAVARLTEHVARLPRENTQVLFCAATIRTLLLPGEDRLLLNRRLEDLTPEASPASLERALRDLSRSIDRPTTVYIFGDGPVRPAVKELLPDRLEVVRVRGDQPQSSDRGITALGVSEAVSGAWNRVDVLVTVQGDQLGTGMPLVTTLDGQPYGAAGVQVTTGPEGLRYFLPDLPARGQRFEVRLAPIDPLPLDDVAAITLPNRPLIRVALDADLGLPLRAVLEADRAVVVEAASPDVTVRRQGDAPLAGPVLEFVSRDIQDDAFVIEAPEPTDLFGARAIDELGLEQIDGTGLAQAADAEIVVTVNRGAVRRIAVWEELLTPEFNFIQSRSFPLFIAGSIRWLGRQGGHLAYAAAGEALDVGPGAVVDQHGRHLDPVGVRFTPPVAGQYVSAAGERIAVSLLELPTGFPEPSPAPSGVLQPALAGNGWDPVTWLLLAALVLLGLEWGLYRKGRMP